MGLDIQSLVYDVFLKMRMADTDRSEQFLRQERREVFDGVGLMAVGDE